MDHISEVSSDIENRVVLSLLKGTVNKDLTEESDIYSNAIVIALLENGLNIDSSTLLEDFNLLRTDRR